MTASIATSAHLVARDLLLRMCVAAARIAICLVAVAEVALAAAIDVGVVEQVLHMMQNVVRLLGMRRAELNPSRSTTLRQHQRRATTRLSITWSSAMSCSQSWLAR